MRRIRKLYVALRPLLGPFGVCVFHESCGWFALRMLETKPLWQALPVIALRLLSCNPITGLFFWLRVRYAQRERG